MPRLPWLPTFLLLLGPLVLIGQGVMAEEVILLDGQQRSGAIAFPSATTITVDGVSMPLSDVDRIVGSGPLPERTGLGLWLVDGSWLPVTALASAADDQVHIESPMGDCTVPLVAVRGWGRALLAATDHDRIQVVSGTYDGRVRGVRDGQLLFTSDALGELPIAFEDLISVRLAGVDKPGTGLRLCAEMDPGQPPLALLPGAVPHLVAAPSATLPAWPRGAVMRVEGGRRVHLSDVTPAKVVEEGAFGRTWPYRRDQALEGGPLLLDGVRYAKGLVVHSRCVLTWNVHQGFERFVATIGLADEVGLQGSCPVVIRGDGKILWQRESMTGRDPAELVSVDLRGVETLEISVDFGARYDIGDRVVLAGASLIALPSKP